MKEQSYLSAYIVSLLKSNDPLDVGIDSSISPGAAYVYHVDPQLAKISVYEHEGQSQSANLLDRLYQKFDSLSHRHDIFKVETIGDAYMAVTNCKFCSRFCALSMKRDQKMFG